MGFRKLDSDEQPSFLPWLNEWLENLPKKELEPLYTKGFYFYKAKFVPKGVILEHPNKFSTFSFKSSSEYKALMNILTEIPPLSKEDFTKGAYTSGLAETKKLINKHGKELFYAPCMVLSKSKPFWIFGTDDSSYARFVSTSEKDVYQICRAIEFPAETFKGTEVTWLLHPNSGSTFEV